MNILVLSSRPAKGEMQREGTNTIMHKANIDTIRVINAVGEAGGVLSLHDLGVAFRI